jgi:hypothetical protein
MMAGSRTVAPAETKMLTRLATNAIFFMVMVNHCNLREGKITGSILKSKTEAGIRVGIIELGTLSLSIYTDMNDINLIGSIIMQNAVVNINFF